LIRAYCQSPFNAMTPEPLYLAPPILGQSKSDKTSKGDATGGAPA